MRTVRSTKGAVNQGASSVSVIARRCKMKWQHWLVWGLLASGAIGLGACMAPEQQALHAENEKLRKQLAEVKAQRDTLLLMTQWRRDEV